MALLLRKRLIAIETESTYGTDPTPERSRRRSRKGSEHHSSEQ